MNERFAIVVINKDDDSLTTRNATFALVDAFACSTANSKRMLSLKRNRSSCPTELRKKNRRTFYKWSAPRHPKLSNPKRVALRLGITVKSKEEKN